MDRYMRHARTGRCATAGRRWSIGVARLRPRRSSLFATLPHDLPAARSTATSAASRSRWCRARRSSRPGGRRQGRRGPAARSPRSRPPSPTSASAAPSIFDDAEEGPQADQHRVRARACARAQPDRRRPRSTSSRRRRRRAAATSRSCSAATIRSQLEQHARTSSSSEMRALPELRRAARRRRPAAAGDHDQAAARSRRRPRRHDRGAEPDDPHRDAGRHRPEQRQILALRPPDPDPRRARRESRAATSRRSRICRCRPPSGGSVPLQASSPRSASAPARRRSSASTRSGASSIGADLAPGVGQRRRERAKIDAAAGDEEPAARAFEQVAVGEAKWQAELVSNFIIAVRRGRLAGLRGAGAALPRVAAAVRQHGLAAAGAARRRDRAAPRRQCRSRCR